MKVKEIQKTKLFKFYYVLCKITKSIEWFFNYIGQKTDFISMKIIEALTIALFGGAVIILASPLWILQYIIAKILLNKTNDGKGND